MDLVPQILSLWLRACSPKTSSMARDSLPSPAGVRGGVRVDVAHFFRLDARVFQCGSHAALRACALRGDAGHVIGVGTHAVADHFGQDLCAARLGELQLLKNQDAGAFADDKAVAILVKGAAGAGGFVVAGGERAHGGKSAHRERR